MRKIVIFSVAVALLGASFGYLLENKSSYVLIVYENQAFETSLWFFILLVLFVFILLRLLGPLVFSTLAPRKRFNEWAKNRRVAASKRDFFQAIMDFETGAWDRALKKFKAAAAHLERPIVAYLYAARTAQHLDRKDIREEMLHEAAQSEPKSALAVGLVRAELLIDEKNYAEARSVLEGLKKASPQQHRVVELLSVLRQPNSPV